MAEKEKRSRKASPPSPKEIPPCVIDASGLVLGRASSLIAQRLLAGERVAVVNAEKAVVLGSKTTALGGYTAAVARGSVRKGPHYPRGPERIFRRTVRGMLPFHRSTGREAFQRLSTYVGVPEALQGKPVEVLEKAVARPSLQEPLTLLQISRLLGAKI